MMVISCITPVLGLFETNTVQIYCLINPKVENRILKKNPPKMHMLVCTFNKTGVKRTHYKTK